MFVPLLVARNALRHKLRTLLTVAGIVVAIVAFGLLRTVVDAWYAGANASSSTRLVTRNAVPEEVVRRVTATLFENQRELSLSSRLASFVSQPALSGATLLPVHPGAAAFYNRDQPSFFQENAEPIGVTISVAAIFASLLLWVKRRWEEGNLESLTALVAETCVFLVLKLAFRTLHRHRLTSASVNGRLDRDAYEGFASDNSTRGQRVSTSA